MPWQAKRVFFQLIRFQAASVKFDIWNVCITPASSIPVWTHRIICHINNWLENDDRTFKCHQYQMCKQLIKTTLSVIIVANWLRKDTLKERRYSQCCRGLSLSPPSPVSARGCPRCCWGSCRPAPASSPVQWEPGKVKAFNFLSAKML